MKLEQALNILNYQKAPTTVDDQIALIRVMKYRTLRGGGPIERCSDQQISRVAKRLFRQAEQVVTTYWEKIAQEENIEERTTEYHTSLCDTFNIPEEQQPDTSIEELERRLFD